MSFKVLKLDYQLDKFKGKLKGEHGAYSEQGMHFQQDVLDFEPWYLGQCNENIMGDYIWGLLLKMIYNIHCFIFFLLLFLIIFYIFYIYILYFYLPVCTGEVVLQ